MASSSASQPPAVADPPHTSGSNNNNINNDNNDGLGPNPYASSSRWRHAESSAFLRYEQERTASRATPGPARDAETRSTGVSDLADFLNKSRLDPSEIRRSGDGGPVDRPSTPRYKPIVAAAAEGEAGQGGGAGQDGKEVVCGPLLNYRRMEGRRWWVGSVLIVTAGGGREQPSRFVPTLVVRRSGGGGKGDGRKEEGEEVKGACLYSDSRNTFWRFDVSVEMHETAETRWEYELPGLRFASATKPKVNRFVVPAAGESMRIMFYSCNGFSVGTDEAAWSGLALWNDVRRKHEERPFHVMIGGGDQIYNDGIRVSGPLQGWSGISNPKKRKDHPFPETLRRECDDYYLKNYIRWYSTEPFAAMNGQIPQLNIWDDHDIIDGFGSYVNEFMKCDVFRGIGGVAHKYYMLFQHHLPPPPSTYTSDAPHSTGAAGQGSGVDPNQLVDVYVHPELREPNYIYGPKPGPYVAEHSHNLFTQLGARIAFLGIDARTERTRHQVNYPETYDAIFSRLKEELSAAAQAGRPYKHLILLLGIPIAYPRLTWLENIFSSPVMGPMKFLNRRIGFGGSFFNSFDGSVDLLDDLDDHYTARTHKKERNWLIKKLQTISGAFSVRITILSGDVHLAAFGRFYSNPRLGVPIEQDYRYIANVISSAIVNKPPPAAVANLLARRNKIHHLNADTDETLLRLFDRDPGEAQKTASHNQVTMPSRNFAVITENSPGLASSLHPTGGHAAAATVPARHGPEASSSSSSSTTDGHYPIHHGEADCGTGHRAADPNQHGRLPLADGSLDVCIYVEQDQHDPEGKTRGYGLNVPALAYEGPRPESVGKLVLTHPVDETGEHRHHHHPQLGHRHQQHQHQQQQQQIGNENGQEDHGHRGLQVPGEGPGLRPRSAGGRSEKSVRSGRTR
ncbi:hypothetical protein VTJ83DRAFT_2167 [Remersonia thermophila]|uniref:PhoD-like phosphatase domain-containing protein n=1 Tax=Remersonia thermophila TaxID=72144 RepID=A0ABR4DHX9_9PEZI